MADLCLMHPRLNPYYRDARIRRYLLDAGLINRHGDIVRGTKTTTTAEEAIAQSPKRRRKPRDRSIKQLNANDILHRPLPDEVTRPKSAHPSTGNLRAKSARRPATSKRRSSPPPPPKEHCRLTLRYLKPASKIDHELNYSRQKGDEIIIMQQHCGGENCTVYKGFVQPGGTFAFDSKRYPRYVQYPFALAFYINGLIDSRVSVCCEYRHKKNVPLGGPSGLFTIIKINKGQPCPGCEIRFEKKRNKFPHSLEHAIIEVRRTVKKKVEHHGRSPSLPRPQSPTPPLEGSIEEKRPKKRGVSKKKIKTQQSTATTRDSPLISKINDNKTKSPIISQGSDSENSHDRQLMSSIAYRKASSSTDNEDTKPKVEQKLNRTLSDDDDSDNDTEISMGAKTPSPKPIKPILEHTDSLPDNSNYAADFDEASDDDDDEKPKSNSQSTQKKTISTGSSENFAGQESSELFNSKKSQQSSNTINDEKLTYIRQNSTDSSENFLDIKRSAPKQNYEDDFFQSDAPKNQTNKQSWRDDGFFDTK